MEKERQKSPRDIAGDTTRCPECGLNLHKRSLDRHMTSEHAPRSSTAVGDVPTRIIGEITFAPIIVIAIPSA